MISNSRLYNFSYVLLGPLLFVLCLYVYLWLSDVRTVCIRRCEHGVLVLRIWFVQSSFIDVWKWCLLSVCVTWWRVGGGGGWGAGGEDRRRGRAVKAVDSGWTGCARFEFRFRYCSRPQASECHFTGQPHGVASGRCQGGRLRTMPRGRRSPCAMWVKPDGWGKPLSRQNSVHLFLFYIPFCFTSAEARMLIRDAGGGGWGGKEWRLDRGHRPKKTGETVDRRQNNGNVKTVSPRHCPATCALRNCCFNCLAWAVIKTMSVALLLRNNPKRKKSNFRSPAPPPCLWSLLGWRSSSTSLLLISPGTLYWHT